ncbi:MAG: hypothetical protein MUF64_07265, partial [Polyangiaceae bacterium]|nr:hypothetical protein [Polyangiaceae bacterium]
MRSKEELAALLSDPQLWGNLEVGVESKGQVASVLRGPADAGPQLLVRIDGLSPLGAESPATCVVLDGGGEPRTIACRYLIHVERAVHILSRYAETGTRPTLDEAGQPLLWGNPVVSREGWETIGRLDEFPLDEDVLSLVYWERPDAEDIETHQDEPPSKPLGIHLTGRALTEDEASRLPHTGLWPLLRGLFHISDPRWFELLAAHPMAWLRDLAVSTPEITRLADALAAMPRILELQLVAPLDPEAIPALASPSLRTLVLGVGSARAVQAILDRMSFPRLRTLVLHDDE